MGINNTAGTGVCLCGRCGTENCTAFLLGCSKHQRRCGINSRRQLLIEHIQALGVRAEQLHLFLNGSLDSLNAGSEKLSGVKALALKVLACLNILSCSIQDHCQMSFCCSRLWDSNWFRKEPQHLLRQEHRRQQNLL